MRWRGLGAALDTLDFLNGFEVVDPVVELVQPEASCTEPTPEEITAPEEFTEVPMITAPSINENVLLDARIEVRASRNLGLCKNVSPNPTVELTMNGVLSPTGR